MFLLELALELHRPDAGGPGPFESSALFSRLASKVGIGAESGEFNRSGFLAAEGLVQRGFLLFELFLQRRDQRSVCAGFFQFSYEESFPLLNLREYGILLIELFLERLNACRVVEC